jgi:thiol:disulfide interchange protein
MKRLPLLLFLALAASSIVRAAPEYPALGSDIYDPKSDGNAQIAAALATAKTSHKNVLLMFGANWCVWCHRLHHTMETDVSVAKNLRENYVLVLIDSNWRHGEKRNYDVNLRYGNPLQEGLPVFVVLNAAGQQLTTQESGVLEDGEVHSAAKVNAFLVKWAPEK